MCNFIYDTCTCMHWCYLWNYGDPGPQVMKPYFGNIDSVNVNVPLGSLQDPENSKGQRRFSGSSPAHNPNLEKRITLIQKAVILY